MDRFIKYSLLLVAALSVMAISLAYYTWPSRSIVVPERSVNAATANNTAKPPTSTDLISQAKQRDNGHSTQGELESALRDLQGVPQGAVEYKEAQSLVKSLSRRIEQAKKDRIPNIRNTLKASYESAISEANPHLNFIRTKFTPIKGGVALWAVHEFFSEYSLSIGDDAKIIQVWIADHRSELLDAGIVRVGVMSSESFAGSSYFDVK